MNPLGIHHIPVHTGQHHYEHIRRVQPGILKTVAGEMPDVQLLSDAYQAAPNAIQYWRNHALSEQHADLWRDPVGTAKRHVAELVRDVRKRLDEAKQRGLPMPDFEQVHILGINEPVIEQFERMEDGRNLVEWTAMMNHRAPLLDDYMAMFGMEALEHGICAGLGNFSSGQSPNRKPGAYPTFTWFPKTTRVLEANRWRLALAVHEYWTAATGPQARWDWHTHRFKHYEVDCDIDVLECGVEEHIDGKPHHGWQGLISADTYAAQMETYIRRCMTDSRFRGATPFTLDGHGQWRTFYIEDAMPEFEALADRLRTPQQSHTVHIPVVIGPPSQPDPEPTVLPPTPQPQPPRTLDVRVMEAIAHVESGRRAFAQDGRLIVRVEAHLLLSEQFGKPDLFAPYFSFTPNNILDAYYRQTPQGEWIAYHGDQRREHEALALARRLHNETALRCTSMGASQVMGFNAARVGFRNAQDMYDVMSGSESSHYVAMCNYMLSDPALHAAVNARDWPTIGKLYNGSAAAGEKYRAAYVSLWGN